MCHWDYLLKEMVSHAYSNIRNGCSKILSRKEDGKLIWRKLWENGFYNISRQEVGKLMKMLVIFD